MGSCMDILRKLADYLGGTLPQEESSLVRRHLHSCKVCGLVYQSARRTLQTHFPQPERRRTAA